MTASFKGNRFNLPYLGFGMGLRPQHYADIIEPRPKVDWFEIITENYMDTDGRPRRMLEKIAAHYPIVMHGVALSIGSTDPLDKEYLTKLKALADWLKPQWVSDHLCWTGVQKQSTHDLLPVPYTKEALKHVVGRIKKVQDLLGRPLLLENPSTYMEFKGSQIPEWEFIAQMAEAADCALLLDVNNVYVSCYNHRWDAKQYLDALPMDRVVQVHLSGHENCGTHIIDTHEGHVVDEVWNLYRYVISKTGLLTTMVEWDEAIPEFAVLQAEVERARAVAMREDIPNNLQPQGELGAANADQAPAYKSMLSSMHGAILGGDAKAAKVDEWVRNKEHFPPEAQIGVYINAYRWRLFDVSLEDVTVLKTYLGGALMREVLDAYIEANPSTHFNIARYIEGFPAFVAKHPSIKKAKLPAAAELAQLEVNVTRAFDMQDSSPLTSAVFAGVGVEELLEMELPLRHACFLMHTDYDVNAYMNDVLGGNENAPHPAKKESWLAVYRHNDAMRRLELSEGEYRILLLLQKGNTVGDALTEAIEQGIDPEALMADLQGWFSKWISNHLLAAWQQEESKVA